MGTGALVGLAIPAERVLHMLHHGHELHIATAQRLEELVGLKSPALGRAVHRRHGIELSSGILKHMQSTDHLVESWCPALVFAELVMDVPGAVYGNPCQEIIFGKEPGPFTGNQGAVGLDGVMDFLPSGIAPLELQGLAVKVQAKYEGFPSMPVERDVFHVIRLDIFPHDGLEHLFCHPRFPASVDC